ncbi:zinc finger protein [Loa loa]|uniref:Zinc finger protein n=1 Tax=Loa loa TaxID=7209 RepID=A0A1S0TJ30_LOALO|nr:zinc finger protein [Loa loa]EFO14804.2 zinc finger protein [Loa loa]
MALISSPSIFKLSQFIEKCSDGKTNCKHKCHNSCFSEVKKYKCPHINCSATVQSKTKYIEHFQTHDKPFHYQCKHPGCGKEFRISSTFSNHKKSCQYKPQNSAEGNSKLGRTLADTRNHHIACQSSVNQQDRSNDEYLSEKFNILDDLDGSIFDDLNIPDDVVVDVEDINIDDGNIFDGVVINE